MDLDTALEQILKADKSAVDKLEDSPVKSEIKRIRRHARQEA